MKAVAESIRRREKAVTGPQEPRHPVFGEVGAVCPTCGRPVFVASNLEAHMEQHGGTGK